MGSNAVRRGSRALIAAATLPWCQPLSASASISDLAREIGAVDRQEIARQIEQHRKDTGHRIVVTTIPTASNVDLSDFAGGALGALGPDADNGIALVHDRSSNAARIVAGAALRSRLDSDTLYQVQSATMGPLLNAGDAGQAFREGVARLIELDVPPPPEPPASDLPPLTQQQDTLRIAIIGLPLILMAYALWTLWIHLRNRRARHLARRAAKRAEAGKASPPAPAPAPPPGPAPPAPPVQARPQPQPQPAVVQRPAAAPLPGFGRPST